ncbi:MAG: AarF/ABC1/UbiB kinase family protein [Candidatus Aminicenantes bacterium]|nr:AarF/ABC1/UbiB kinase family protein [Candidatus Aminicenantes bacterium]
MLHKKWTPTPLILPEERRDIPIVTRDTIPRLRRLRGVLRLTGLILKFIFLKIIRKFDAGRMGRIIGDYCQKMGVLWIKLGQLLSMRSDIFPPELCTALSRLQERAEGFSPRVAREIIERELGVPLETYFSEFEEKPCAAASIAQVHRARLKKEKTWVAIKVRRPEIDRIFTRDMSVIRGLFRALQRFAIMPYMRWGDMLWELEQVFTEELDYRYEIYNQMRLRKSLARHNIYVPRVFQRYCTRQILVMEFVEAVSMTDYLNLLKSDPARVDQWLAENKIDSKTVGKRLLHSYLRQVLEDNLFHADLHPGNIFLLRENRIALLDFGSIGSSEGDMLRKYKLFLEALSSGQYSKAIDVFLLIMPDLPPTNLTILKEELQRRLHTWGSRCKVPEIPYKEKSTSTIFDEVTRVLAKYGVTINWAFFKVLRGWMTMDTSLRELIPTTNLMYLMQAYTRRGRIREFKKVLFHLPADFLRLQNLVDVPREYAELAIYRGAMVRRLAQVFEGATTRFSRLAALFFGLGSAFFFFISALFGFVFLFQHTSVINLTRDNPLREILSKIPLLDTQIWFLLLAFMLYGCISLALLARRFRKQE